MEKFYLESNKYPFKADDYEECKKALLDEYGKGLRSYALEFITDKSKTRDDRYFDVTIEIENMDRLVNLIYLTNKGILIDEDAITLYEWSATKHL